VPNSLGDGNFQKNPSLKRQEFLEDRVTDSSTRSKRGSYGGPGDWGSTTGGEVLLEAMDLISGNLIEAIDSDFGGGGFSADLKRVSGNPTTIQSSRLPGRSEFRPGQNSGKTRSIKTARIPASKKSNLVAPSNDEWVATAKSVLLADARSRQHSAADQLAYARTRKRSVSDDTLSHTRPNSKTGSVALPSDNEWVDYDGMVYDATFRKVDLTNQRLCYLRHGS